MKNNLFKFGGKYFEYNNNENIYFTDSGRSSLRIFIKNYSKKKYLIPDFICPEVITLFKSYKINYRLYKINNLGKINLENFIKLQIKADVIYIVNYFDSYDNLSKKLLNSISNKIIIEDNAFSFNFYNRRLFKHWFAFNSFRKISGALDGSLIKTNLKISYCAIIKNNAPFVSFYKKAKSYSDLFKKTGNLSYDEKSLNLVQKSEKTLNNQKKIYQVSNNSKKLIFDLFINLENELKLRKFNFNFFNSKIKNTKLFVDHNFSYSYLVVKVKNAMKLREQLSKKNIYLPIHWLNSHNLNNNLYGNLISIPLFLKHPKKNLIKIVHEFNFYLNEQK